MILRILHILSLLVLLGSAFAVYKVKYESTYEVQKIAKLRKELARAVEAEDYERAAKLRDQIKQAEG